MTDNLNVSESDFSTIKQNLKDFLKNQSQFLDYNFEGAAISVLLDILSYNTHIMAAHANLAFAESFLDSAVLRGSVVSRAKELGYTPRSKSSASADIQVSFTVTGNPTQYVIPKNTKFNATSNGITYQFVTDHDCLIENVNNTFTQVIKIHQGKFTTFQYTVDLNDASQRFVIPSLDADTKFLTVLFKDNITVQEWTPYSLADLISGSFDNLNEAQIFFLKESFDEFFEVYFGDDIVGKALKNNNLIQLEYLITDGALANGAKSFSLASVLTNVNSLSITTIDSATGGDDKESIDSIKFLAPFFYASKGRAVTEDDYKAIIKNQYSNVDDVAVWGGQKNNPPFYGKVFVAIKPKAGQFLSIIEKETIQNDIVSKFNVVTIRPEIVDPDYILVSVNTVINYNGRLFNPTSGIDLNQIVHDAITNFFLSSANRFGQTLYFSKLVKTIDESSPLILNSITNLTLEKQKQVFLGISGNYEFDFNNAIAPGSVLTNEFIINGQTWRIKDIPNATVPPTSGTLAVFRMGNQNNIIFLTQNTGTIDYTTGKINIVNIKINSVVDNPSAGLLTMQVSPGAIPDIAHPDIVYLDDNIYANGREQIITLKSNAITITLIPDNTV